MKTPNHHRYKVLIFYLFAGLLFCNSVNAITKTSAGNGNWATGSNWIPAGVPATGDDVIIAAGHTITINTNTSDLSSLTINGTLVIGNNNTNRTVTVSGNITISGTGNFYTAGNGGNQLRIGGNLINNGSFDMNVGGADANVEFNGYTNQGVTGTGGTNDFSTIDINNSGVLNNNIVEIASAVFTASNGFLTLTDGILKVSGSFTLTNTFFNTANPVIHSDEGLWINNPNVTVSGQNGDTGLYGLLRISNGTYNVGVSADWWLYYYTGAQLIIDGGALNVSGAFFGASTSQTIDYLQTGGVFTVNTAGNNYNVASFEIWAPGSVFNMSGGSIVMQRAATAFTDYVNYSSNSTITGGKIQAGNSATPSGAVFWMLSTPPVYDLEVKLTNSPVFQLRNNTTVLHDINIWGVLDAATQNVDITVGNDWINNGIFLPATSGAVIFNGTSPQSIGGSLATAFNNIVFNNTGGGVSLNKPVTISGAATFTAGIVTSSATNLLTFYDNATATGANNNVTNPSYVNGPVCKIGNDAFTFPVGKSGAGYHSCSISAPLLITDAFTAEYMRTSAAALGPISATGLYTVSNCEYWNLERTLGLSNVNVTLSWNGMSNCNAAAYVNSLASLVVSHFNGTNWNSFGANSYTGNASSGTVTWNNVSSFSPFSLGSNSPSVNPLAVKFTSVKAFTSGANNIIEWTNVSEEGVDKYIVEKSTDGRNFSVLNTTAARNNTGMKESYSSIDLAVQELTDWYRIKAVEISGAVTYSPIVKVSRQTNNDAGLVVFPNPVSGNQFSIQLTSERKDSYHIRIINQAGQQVYSNVWDHPAGNASTTIDLPKNISSGYYVVSVNNNEKNYVSKLIIK
ncbi:MAG TPA: G8 domain-containing protein [Chitinophagaceae bacterium]|nr:G8 domain-containing protein [Chitinophagaceae bacterium]